LFGAACCLRFWLFINGGYRRLGSYCKHQPHAAQLALCSLDAQYFDSNAHFSLKKQVFGSFRCGTLYRLEASVQYKAQLRTHALPRNTSFTCLAIVAVDRVVASHASDGWYPCQHFRLHQPNTIFVKALMYRRTPICPDMLAW
jgi:hypothetical protein